MSGDSGHWDSLASLLDRLLDTPLADRPRVLDALSAGDPARRAELAGLLEECERAVPFFDKPAAQRFSALVDDTDILPAMLANRYQTGAEVGRGGMARVYMARDLKVDRDVAIKVVRAEHATPAGRERFLREIRIVARLRHPNILPLYDAGEIDGALYFVMPFESGRSLRDRLRQDGALPVDDAIALLRDVARALDYAHTQGVAHRDIKPDNVLLSAGAAVVTDFGIASAFGEGVPSGSHQVAANAPAFGTPAYMAPEQAAGSPVMDHRADLYAFGCLAYELFTGHTPSRDVTPYVADAARPAASPRPLLDVRPDVPAPVARVIDACLATSPDDRPQTAKALLEVLEQTHAGPDAGVPPTSHTARTPRHARWRAALRGAVVLLVAASAFVWRQRDTSPPEALTFAVIPFVNTAGDTAMEYLAEAIPDELASALNRVPGILVRSRSGARLYRGQFTVDPTEVGTRLNAEFILTGLLRRERGQWMVKAEVARASDKSMVWEERFTIDTAEQAGAIATIARSLVATLRQEFPGVVGATPAVASARTQLANDFYLGGRAALSRRQQSVRQSAEQFRQAVREDTMFAPAYAGLSMALSLYPYFERVPIVQVFDSVLLAASRAIALDPSLATPHVATGLARQLTFEWTGAESEFQSAVRLDANDVEARVQYARHLLFRGRTHDAMRHLDAARSLDPQSALVLSWRSYAFYLDGRLDSARAESERALSNDPNNFTTIMLGALLAVRSGEQARARGLVGRLPPASPIDGYLHAMVGDSAGALRIGRPADRDGPQVWLSASRRAYALLGVGDTSGALSAFEQATDAGEIWPALYSVLDPMFAPIRGSARFHALLRRVKLPELVGVGDRAIR